MARIKRLLPVAVAVMLLFSLFFVDGSIAQPLGEGLMQHFGLDSSGTRGGTEDATFQFGLPVTVMNDESRPVPVTLPGTLETRDAAPAGAQPYQSFIGMDFQTDSQSTFGNSPDIPAGKQLIVRYVSGWFQLGSDGLLIGLGVRASIGGDLVSHTIPFTKVGTSASGDAVYVAGTETWIEADAGTSLLISALRDASGVSASGYITIAGYLIDAPGSTTP